MTKSNEGSNIGLGAIIVAFMYFAIRLIHIILPGPVDILINNMNKIINLAFKLGQDLVSSIHFTSIH